jgi:peptidoglycan-associated lipoprotein
VVAGLLGACWLLGACGGKPKYPACGGDKDCKPGEHCVNKRCLQCGDDSHCPKGQECKNGACVAKADQKEPEVDTDPRKKCKRDEDCADDEDCVDGRCSRPWEGAAPEGLGCELRPVYFAFDSSAIPDEARDGLGQTADCIKGAGERGVYLVGNTDSRGTEEYNIALSERRAQSVADYLARLGIDPARFRVIPKGETGATGVDEDSYQQDRRVDFEWR